MDYTFKTEHDLTENFLKANFYKIKYALSKPSVDYWLVLPNYVKQFSMLEKHVDSLHVNLIGQYVSQSDMFLDIEVLYEHIAFDLNPSDWILKKLSKLGEAIIAKNESKDSTGIYIDLLSYKVSLANEVFISRITVKKNFDMVEGGANYIAVRAMCRESDYNKLSEVILHSVHNWDYTSKGDWQLAERLIPAKVILEQKISFYIFESWRMFKAESGNTNQIVLRQSGNQKNKGAISIFEIPNFDPLDLDNIVKKQISRVKLTDVDLQKSKMILAQVSNPRVLDAYYVDGNIKNIEEGFDAHIFAYLLKIETSSFYIECIGSKPNYENYNWEMNKRQVEMIIESLNNPKFDRIDRVTINSTAVSNKLNAKIEPANDLPRKSIFF